MPEAHRRLQVVDGVLVAVLFGTNGFRLLSFIPPAKGLRSADAKVGTGNHDPRRVGVDQWKQQIAALEAKHGSTGEKERDIGPETPGYRLQFGVGSVETPERAQREQRRCSVAASAAKTGFHGNALAQVNPDVRQRCSAIR